MAFPFTPPARNTLPIYTPDPNPKILKIPNKTGLFAIIPAPFSSPFTRLPTYTQKK
jgi:hypothetical protein